MSGHYLSKKVRLIEAFLRIEKKPRSHSRWARLTAPEYTSKLCSPSLQCWRFTTVYEWSNKTKNPQNPPKQHLLHLYSTTGHVTLRYCTVVSNIHVYSNYYWQMFKYVYFKFTHPADKFHMSSKEEHFIVKLSKLLSTWRVM